MANELINKYLKLKSPEDKAPIEDVSNFLETGEVLPPEPAKMSEELPPNDLMSVGSPAPIELPKDNETNKLESNIVKAESQFMQAPEGEKKDKAKSRLDDLIQQYQDKLKGLESKRTGASIADAIGTFANIFNSQQDKRFQAPQVKVGALESVGKEERQAYEDLLKERQMLTNEEKEKRLEDYNQALLNMQQQSFKFREDEAARNQSNFDKKYGQEAAQELRLGDQNFVNQARGFLKDDPQYKQLAEQQLSLSNIDEVIGEAEKGNEMSVSALGIMLAKAYGEKGAMSESDVKRYIQGVSWRTKLMEWYKKGAEGELPKEVMNGIKGNLGAIRQVTNKNIDKVYDKAFKRIKTAYPGQPDERIKGVLGFPEKQPSEVQSMEQPSSGVSKDIKTEQYVAKYIQQGKTREEILNNLKASGKIDKNYK